MKKIISFRCILLEIDNIIKLKIYLKMKNFNISSIIPLNVIDSYEFIKILICSGYVYKLGKFQINSSQLETKPLMRLLKITKITFLYSTLSIFGFYFQMKSIKLMNK